MTDDSWRDGPWDRRYGSDVEIRYINSQEINGTQFYECGYFVRGKRVTGTVRADDDGYTTYLSGGSSRISGQVQKWLKELTRLFVVTSFKDVGER